MPETFTITINAILPHEKKLLELFLQHIRDFDVVHEGCRFSIIASTNLTIEQMEAALSKITPPFRHRASFRKH